MSLRRGFTAALVIVAGISLVLIFFLKGEIPVKAQYTLESSALQGTVEVLRDNFGVPHIYGDHSADLLFAVGYSQMEDRAFQLEILRRVGAGELAEVFGEVAVDADIVARRSSYSDREIESMLAAMKPEHRAHLEAMLAGINHYVAQMQAQPQQYLPLEFQRLDIEPRPYTVTDLVDALSIVVRVFGSSGGYELKNQTMLDDLIALHGESNGRTLFNDVMVLTDPDAYAFTAQDEGRSEAQVAMNDATAQSPAPDSIRIAANQFSQRLQRYESALALAGLTRGASRSLVVGPERSVTGNVLMMQATADGHEVHIEGAGMKVAGLSLAPFGLPIMGRGRDFGWLITTGEQDTKDIYVEQLHPQDKHRYWFEGEWRDMDVRIERIKVAGGDDVELEVARTVHGEVVEWDTDNRRAYALRWAIWGQELEAWSSFLNIARAPSREAISNIISAGLPGSVNISVGGEDGHIQSWQVGRIPIRADGVDPRLPTPGTGEFEWEGFVAPADLPSIANPERGYLVVWNNKPAANTLYGDGARWGKHFRTYLPLRLLDRDDSISIEDLREINRTLAHSWGSVDLQTTDPAYFLPFLDEALAEYPDPKRAQLVDTIRLWDGTYVDKDRDGNYDHPGLLIYSTWRRIAMDTLFSDDLGEWHYKFDADVYIKYGTSLLLRALEGEDAGLPTVWDFLNGSSRSQVITRTLNETWRELEALAGKDPAEWRQPVYWRYQGLEALSEADSDRPAPSETSFVRSTGYTGAGVTLGYLDAAIPHNGAPDWMAIMEIAPGAEGHMETATPAGGQCWFIDYRLRACRHLADQVTRHQDLNLKVLPLQRREVETVVESTLTMLPLR